MMRTRMESVPEANSDLQPTEPGSRRPYEAPILVEWGSIRELTAGPFFDDHDGDFSGSGGG